LKCVVEWSDKYRALIDPLGHAWRFASIGEPHKVRVRKRERDGC
jgi:hypothetical protein